MKLARYLVALATIGMVNQVNADHHLKPVDLTGVWNAMATTDDSVREITWTFKKDGDKVTGISLDHESGDERTLDRIVVKEKKVAIEIDLEVDGNTGIIKIETEEKKPGKLVGKWSIVSDDGTVFMSGDVTAVKEVAFAGEWNSVSILPDGNTHESVLQLKGKNDALKGVFEGRLGEVEIDKIKASDNEVKFEFDFELDGNTINCVIKAEAKGNDKLVGKWVVIGDDGDEAADGEWTAERKSRGLAGKWAVVATIPNSDDYSGTLELKEENGKYAGTSAREGGDAKELKTVSVDGKSIKFTVPFERDEYTGTVTIEAKVQDDGSLKGEWALTGDDGTEYARDEWKATRK